MKSHAKWTDLHWHSLLDCLSDRPSCVPPRTLLLAAHQDDETIGATQVLARIPNCTVVFLTDGAPRSLSLRSSNHSLSREQYASLRQNEALQALSCVGVGPERVLNFGVVDQEAIHQVPELVIKLVTLIQELRPQILMTPSYEGGHPDHDAAALIAYLSNQLIAAERHEIPLIAEMALYHARDEQLITGEFVTASQREVSLVLSATERARKERMLACYASQRRVLQSFGTAAERIRPAPAYDFTKPPHAGKLWYECLGWPMTVAKWRDIASATLTEFQCNLCL